MKELANINEKILEKVDNLDISNDKKVFLKKLLLEEFLHRDKHFKKKSSNAKNSRYEPLIDEYCEGD